MVHIITDSMSDFPRPDAAAMNVEILPMRVHFPDESFDDDGSITQEEFFERLKNAEKLPKTSQVTPGAFLSAFRRALSRGGEVLALICSSEMSGTYQSAVLAREELAPEERARVYLVDTLSGSLGLTQFVHEAVRLRDAGENAATIQKAIQTLIPQQVLLAQVEDLKYLVMGGRLSSVGARVGTVLNLKPMIHLKAGKLEMAGIVRGTKHAFEWVAQQLRDAPLDPRYPIYFASSLAAKALDSLVAYLQEKNLIPASLVTMGVGAVVGSHMGPGCLAVCWIQGVGNPKR